MGIFSRLKNDKNIVPVAIVSSMTDKNTTSVLSRGLDLQEEELSTLHIERIFLECFGLELASNLYFRTNNDKKIYFLDKFYNILYEHYYEISPKACAIIESTLKERLNEYSQLMRSHSDSDLQIAKAFSKHFNKDNNPDFIKKIRIYFIMMVKSYSEEILPKFK